MPVALWAAHAQLKLGDEGVLFQKEARKIGSGERSFNTYQTDFSISAPVLGPPPRLLPEHLTPMGGFIRVLQCYTGCFFNFPNSGPGFRLLESASAFVKSPSVLQHPKFHGCCLLLISFSLKMYSLFNKTFYSYFSGVGGRMVVKYVCSISQF